eukprot:CAMPEP_0197539190 /NCGR_PEP_ID=MMETSP1318-20131121/61908_1 /TAXON_ID=552666 /ORGANISM="Partenskyella glossopodia, Strain RCC365" /LENGTH=58 /DNA_ID=CAMNT_0043097831 /DNA_START=27 /DNA_END=203 /DNA_ORIENTATION=+
MAASAARDGAKCERLLTAFPPRRMPVKLKVVQVTFNSGHRIPAGFVEIDARCIIHGSK